MFVKEILWRGFVSLAMRWRLDVGLGYGRMTGMGLELGGAMQYVRSSKGAISYGLIRRESGGWDIDELTVCQRDALVRKGEFETQKEAESAAIERAKAFAKKNGLAVD